MQNELICVAIAIGFNSLDILSGFIAALKKRDVKSSKMRTGLFNKLAYVLAYIIALMIDYAQRYVSLGYYVSIVTLLVIYAITTEIVSILENLVKINPQMGDKKFLAIFRNVEKEEEEEGK